MVILNENDLEVMLTTVYVFENIQPFCQLIDLKTLAYEIPYYYCVPSSYTRLET
jgi:hypothetical protein